MGPDALLQALIAKYQDHPEVAEWDSTDTNQPCYPMHYAAARGRVDAVEKLLELGADESLENEFGGTALSYAVRDGHTTVASLLRKAKKTSRKNSQWR